MNITKDYYEVVASIRNEYPNYEFKCEKYSPIHRCNWILREILETERNINQISAESKKSSAFNDKHLKYSNITNEINKSLIKIERDINTVKTKDIPKAKVSHCEEKMLKNCIDLLNSKVGDLSLKFKKFLQTQTDIIKKVEERRNSLVSQSYSSKASVNEFFEQSKEGDDIELNLGNNQQELQGNVYANRLNEVQSIEKIMTEISGMMKRMGEIIFQQSFVIKNIEKNTDIAYGNVALGAEDVRKMRDDVKSNRALLIKVCLIVIVVSVVYILFMA